MELKLILTGLGGQGVIFLTRMLANTAVSLNHPVMVSETHGMSQRGGSVMSHLKIGGSEAPLIRRGTADILLALEPGEAIRNLTFLRPGGAAFVNSEDGLPSALMPHLERLDMQLLSLPASQMALEFGAVAATNVIMAGFAAAHPALGLPIDALRQTVKAISRRNLELNVRALEEGFKAGQAAVAQAAKLNHECI